MNLFSRLLSTWLQMERALGLFFQLIWGGGASFILSLCVPSLPTNLSKLLNYTMPNTPWRVLGHPFPAPAKLVDRLENWRSKQL